MKKYILLLFAFVIINNTYGQKYKGIQEIGASAFKSDFGYMAQLQYQNWLSNNITIKPSVIIEFSNYLQLKSSSYYANCELLYDFFKSTKKSIFVVGGGATINYDEIDKQKELGQNVLRTSLNIGFLASAQYEYYITQRASFLISTTFNFNPYTKFSSTKYWGGIGFNYIIF